MRIGMVCPYSFDEPGGVQVHVLDLAAVFRAQGHEVSVIGPASEETALPDFVVRTGKAVAIPYNGSVARLSLGLRPRRVVRDWIAHGEFDVLHIHEPNSPSTSLLALALAEGPIVATYHTSTTRSLALKVASGPLEGLLEKIRGGIAVSSLARRWQVEALGQDPVQIPNGVDAARFRGAQPFRHPQLPESAPVVSFLGRFDEPRKGMHVLLEALPLLCALDPQLTVVVMGGGDAEELRQRAGSYADRLLILGRVDEATKAQVLARSTMYVAPNTGGESFGIVLVEAMMAGSCVVASDLEAFSAVLDQGAAGALFRTGDAADLARVCAELLGDAPRRAKLCQHAAEWSQQYDWSVVAADVLRVYDLVRAPGEKVTL